MRKYFPMALLVLFLTAGFCCPSAGAETTTWDLKWNSDNSLDETVVVSGHNVVIEDNGWKTDRSEQGVVLTRHTSDWEEYGVLKDRIPLELMEKNFVLIKFSSLSMAEQEVEPGSLYEQFAGFEGARLSIDVPGIIRESSAEKQIDSRVTWNMAAAPAVALSAIIFDGVIVGITFFVLCFIIIFFLFASQIKKVNRLIDTEYSLQRADEEFARTEPDEEKEPGKS